MQSKITPEALEKLQKALLGYMSSIDSLLEDEPFNSQEEHYESIPASRLDDIKWQISQVEIHVGRLKKQVLESCN